MMMSFCKKSVHSFLGFTNFSKDNETVLDFHHHHHHRNYTTTAAVAGGGLGLFTISNNIQKPTNVVESAAIKSPPTTSMVTTTITTATTTDKMAKKDPGRIGFLDEVGGSVDGLMSCTESLGFESSDERRVDDDHEKSLLSRESSKFKSICKRKHVKREVRKFPPPLSSLDHVGRPTIYLHPVRKDGRLELTGVKINRIPDFLHASREDGRLRLNLVRNKEDDIPEEEGNQEEQEEEFQESAPEESDQEKEVKEKEEERVVDRWRFPVASGGGGDGFRRCNELESHYCHHHRHLNVWRQHCLTIT